MLISIEEKIENIIKTNNQYEFLKLNSFLIEIHSWCESINKNSNNSESFFYTKKVENELRLGVGEDLFKSREDYEYEEDYEPLFLDLKDSEFVDVFVKLEGVNLKDLNNKIKEIISDFCSEKNIDIVNHRGISLLFKKLDEPLKEISYEEYNHSIVNIQDLPILVMDSNLSRKYPKWDLFHDFYSNKSYLNVEILTRIIAEIEFFKNENTNLESPTLNYVKNKISSFPYIEELFQDVNSNLSKIFNIAIKPEKLKNKLEDYQKLIGYIIFNFPAKEKIMENFVDIEKNILKNISQDNKEINKVKIRL